MPIYYIDGEYLPAERAVIPVDDLALLRGLGAFELLRTHKGQPLFLEDHLARLEQSMHKIGLVPPYPRADLVAIVGESLRRNRHKESNIRIIVTGGSSPDFMTPQGRPRLLVLVTELPELPAAWYTDGIKVITVTNERSIPGAKSTNYLAATVAMRTARSQGAVEAIYTDRDGLAFEGTTSNLFCIAAGRLVTPGRGILDGITRKVILEVAAPLVSVDIRDLPLEELLAADEAFITGTNKGLVPVVQVNETRIGDGRPGPHTRAIMAALEIAIETAIARS
jgi:branched-chain amino acid aminotransferase